MIFDLFHSISDPVIHSKSIGPRKSIENFIDQVRLAEELEMDTAWVAESHFSSEVQKQTSVATIQNFFGEVGLNCDSFQLFNLIERNTKKINFGTGIHNIVGGSGGPIASAERVNFLRFINQNFVTNPREIRLGVAAGRFPYQNTPFGIVPRDAAEQDFWPIIKRIIFLEALEIFVRLLKFETIASQNITSYQITAEQVTKEIPKDAVRLLEKYTFPLKIKPRYDFEKIKLIPECDVRKKFQLVLGSHDPEALTLAYKHWKMDLFNLSFTSPEMLQKTHDKLELLNKDSEESWKRSRLPRTVMVFIDPDTKKATELAHFVLDAYIEAMKGTAQVPDKSVLMQRALIGDAVQVREQLHPENPRRFHADDRLMLWFEFNQLDNDAVKSRMKYFFKEVVGKM